jgi:cell wall-associated NlpC family hydrolase
MIENRPADFEDANKKPLGGSIYKILLVIAALVILVLVFNLDALHSNDSTESRNAQEASSREDVAQKPANPLDDQVDDERTTAFAPSFRCNYLSGVLLSNIDVFTPVDSYMDIVMAEQTAANMTQETVQPTENDPEEQETEAESTESETTESESTEPESTEDTTPESTEPETTEPEPEYDPRTTVWTHYPNLGVVVAPNYLHIRTEPSMDGQIVGILFNMSGVNLLDVSEDGEWYHIISNGIEGYINAEYVATGEEAKALAYENCFAAVTVNAEVLNVRQEPNTDAAILTQIISGSLYAVSEETNEEWLKVVISGEIEGYVAREFVTYDYALQDAVEYTPEPEEEIPSINPVRLEIVNNAMQYLGGTYVWGGTTLGVGVDCSGFMLRIFEQYGYNLPRTSYWQVNTGTPVSFEEMQPGDLIFYWNNNLGRVGHVALYMGNNLIIHAASEQRGIVIDDYRFMTPYCARNIIGE